MNEKTDMFKNQLQELAQRSCFNLPSYACVREGPDHAPRFRASVNFNGEIFESPSYCPTLRQAEHAAAEVALNMLSCKGPSKSLTARVLDETGIYKNLLQETAHRVGLKLPVYTTVRSGPGHVPVFSCTVVLAGMDFSGEPAKTKKQAEKNAAIAAWSALKRMPSLDSLTNKEEQDQAIVARVLSNLKPKDDNSSKQQFNNNRRKDHQNQARRKLVKGNNSSSSSMNNSSLEYRGWKLLDLLLDSALDCSNKKKTSFVSLLPPPPPRTASKILPPPLPTLYRPSLRSKASFLEESNGKTEEEWPNSKILPYTTLNRPNLPAGVSSKSILLEESHREDEEEWLYGGKKPDVISTNEGSSSNYRSFALNHNTNSILDDKDHYHPSINRSSPSNPYGKSSYINRGFYATGGFNPQRIAPAVQIRSVIPVCAAPPPRPPLVSGFSPLTTTTTTTTIEAKVSSSSELSQLSSEFHKLQL